jgi:acyl-CoA thioesterase I
MLKLSFFLFVTIMSDVFGAPNSKEIRYVAVGDSYSSGEGATPEQSWPALLTGHLKSEGIKIRLVANPSVTGWTTQQAIEHELPVFRDAKPTFATLLIGVNDWVQGITAEKFRENLNFLIEQMLSILPGRNRMLLVTIPDFSVMPNGPNYARGRDISQGINGFNQIIKEEAARWNLPVADIFQVSQCMHDDPTLVAPDGLHPTAKAYRQWETIIFPAAFELLKK